MEQETQRRELSEDLLRSLHGLFRAMRSSNPFGLITRMEFFTMMYIAEQCGDSDEGIRISDLAAAQEMSFPAQSKLLRVMEQKGYICRTRDQADHRVYYIKLTEKGWESIRRGREAAVDQFSGMITGISDDEIRQLIVLQERLLWAIKESQRNSSCRQEKEEIQNY